MADQSGGAFTHVYLVSAQATPNLTPALDPATRPRRVVLVVSPDMAGRAEWLAEVLRGRVGAVDLWPIDDAWDIEAIHLRLIELLDAEQARDPDATILLNATGGTKPMSIAAYEEFRSRGLPIFYVLPEQDRLVWLHNPAGWEPRDLADRVAIEPFLQAHGARPTCPPRRNIPDAAGLELAGELVAGIEDYRGPLAALNGLAKGAERSLVSEPLYGDEGPLQDLIDLFERYRYLRRGDGGRLVFPSEEARFFVNGGWIEGYVFDAVRRVRAGDATIQDVAHGVKVEREQGGETVPNELDVVFLRNNRLHIIECKTRRLPGHRGEDGPGAEALYKLEALRDLMGGLQARAMLLSFQDLGRHDRTRAADLRIHVCAGRELRDLEAGIRRFMA